jgi:hypothetical protein
MGSNHRSRAGVFADGHLMSTAKTPSAPTGVGSSLRCASALPARRLVIGGFILKYNAV